MSKGRETSKTEREKKKMKKMMYVAKVQFNGEDYNLIHECDTLEEALDFVRDYYLDFIGWDEEEFDEEYNINDVKEELDDCKYYEFCDGDCIEKRG
jgi:radical SAM protein with 4Fe4S-binding SPASM domain